MPSPLRLYLWILLSPPDGRRARDILSVSFAASLVWPDSGSRSVAPADCSCAGGTGAGTAEHWQGREAGHQHRPRLRVCSCCPGALGGLKGRNGELVELQLSGQEAGGRPACL